MSGFSPFSVSPMHEVAPAIPVALAVATALAALCAVAAAALHLTAARLARRRARYEARLEPLALEVLSGDLSPRSLAARVRPEEADAFLRLLVRLALRLSGSSRAVLAEAARPFVSRARALLRARSPERRALGAHTLGLLGRADDRELLVGALADPSPGVAMVAARALADSGDVGTLPALIASLHRFEAWGTPAIASMLARYGTVGGGLIALRLVDPMASDALRVACAEALRRIGYQPAVAAVEPLLQARAQTPREVRAAVLRLVADIGTDAQAPAVRRLVNDLDPVVRLHALSALGALGDADRDAPALEAALADGATPWVALRAARALDRLGRRDVLERAARRSTQGADAARQILHAS